jgi:hypothetical protein
LTGNRRLGPPGPTHQRIRLIGQHEPGIPANGKLQLKGALQRLAQLYEATGRSDQAALWKQKLAEFDKAEPEKQSVGSKP